CFFFFSSRRRHTRWPRDWSSDVCSCDLTNMSSDPEIEYFGDGIAEEIINALAQLPGLRVAGRSSAFSFKGKREDLRVIGDKLSRSEERRVGKECKLWWGAEQLKKKRETQ